MGGVASTEPDQAWVLDVLSQLTPNASRFAADAIKGSVEPAVRKSLEGSDVEDGKGGKLPAADFRFTTVDLGTVPPKITNVKTRKDETGEGVVVDFDLEYRGDCNLQVSLMGMRCGVRDLSVCGRARIVMRPKTSSAPPFFGGVQFCFLDEISVDFDLEGLANIGDWSFIRKKMRKAIVKDVSKRCVYPNKVIIPTSSVDPMKIKCFDPRGVFGLKVVRGAGLPKKGGLRSLVGQGKPDAYVVAKLGATRRKTSVVKNSTDPVWEEEGWYNYLLEQPRGHTARLLAYDHDSFSRDDFLGTVVVSLEDRLDDLLLQEGGEGVEATFPLVDDGRRKDDPLEVSGELTVTLRWLPLKPLNELGGADPAMAVLTVFVYSCNNLVELADGSAVVGGEEEGVPGEVVVRATVGGNGAPQVSEAIKNTHHPNFEHGFTFELADVGGWSGQTATLVVSEKAAGATFGQLELNLADVAENSIRRKVFSLNQEKPMVTITLSASLKFA